MLFPALTRPWSLSTGVPLLTSTAYHWASSSVELDATLGRGKVSPAHLKITDHSWHETQSLTPMLPLLRVLLIWDNLKGHLSRPLMCWCVERGILPLYTPIAGSWLNMAESVQRILVHRALTGHHPHTVGELMAWLAATVRVTEHPKAGLPQIR